VCLGKVEKPRMVLKDEKLMAIQHIYMARTCLYGYQHIYIWQVHMHEFLQFIFVPRIHLERHRVSINYTENVVDLLMHTQTVGNRHSSPIIVKLLGMRLQPCTHALPPPPSHPLPPPASYIPLPPPASRPLPPPTTTTKLSLITESYCTVTCGCM